MLITFGLLLFARFIAPATAGTGAHGWINLPMFNIEPAEIFKIVIILYLASLSSHRLDKYQRKSRGTRPHRPPNLNNQNTTEKVKMIFGYTRFQVIFVLSNLLIVVLMPDLGNALIALFFNCCNYFFLWSESQISFFINCFDFAYLYFFCR
ncbi:hypothetical protein AAX21_02345 [Oenococcus oeni]|nr:hypothetical protein AAX21_02345 [Oenococcus oeni]